MNDLSIITISGDLGSGKSTVAKTVAGQLGFEMYSTGSIQRALAAELGVTSLALNQMAETDPTIDERIDSRTVETASSGTPVLFDSRLAWHLVPQSFKVFLTVDPKIGAQRIFSANRGPVEQYGSIEAALADVNARRVSENKRYAELYGINPERLTNYDLCIDTSYATPDLIGDKIVEGFHSWQFELLIPRLWFSPKTPFPTAALDTLHPSHDHGPVEKGGKGPLARIDPVQIIKVGRYYYIRDGHQRVSSCILSHRVLMPAEAAFSDDDPMPAGLTARRFIEQNGSLSKAYRWESIHGFHYPSYPPNLPE